MTLKIDRFEKIKQINKRQQVIFESETGFLIKDHKTDKYVSYIQLDNIQDENSELADRIISVIETYIEEKDAENQH